MKRSISILFVVQLAVAALLAAAGAAPARADGKTKLAQEAADCILQRFGRQAAKEGAESLSRKIEAYAVRHGDEFFLAVRNVGPQAFRLVEEAGEYAPQAVRALARYGEDGALWIVARPRALRLYVEQGEEAAAVLARTHGVAEEAVAALGKPAVNAFRALATGQNARRLAMMASDGGELAAIGRTPEVLDVIAKYGDPAMDFLWHHKGVLASGVVLAGFLSNPEPYLAGVKDITQVVAENTVKPVATTMVHEAAAKANWTVIFSLAVLALGGLAALRSWRKARTCHHS